MILLALLIYTAIMGGIVIGAMAIAYNMGYKSGQLEMHWAHFDKGCYLDGNGEVYAHLRDVEAKWKEQP